MLKKDSNALNSSFPIARKYPEKDTYFLIHSSTQYEQLQIIGKYFEHTQLNATKYPEQLFIHEMINNDSNRFQEINVSVFKDVLNECKKMLTPLA